MEHIESLPIGRASPQTRYPKTRHKASRRKHWRCYEEERREAVKTIMNNGRVLILEEEAAEYLEVSIDRLQEITDQELLAAYYKTTGSGIEIAYDFAELFAFNDGGKK